MKVKYEIKPLEWQPTYVDNVRHWRASTVMGWYHANTMQGGVAYFRDASDRCSDKDYPTIDDAKAAAEEHYRTRLASALTPSPDAGGMRKALEQAEKALTLVLSGTSDSRLSGGPNRIAEVRVARDAARSALASPAAEGDVEKAAEAIRNLILKEVGSGWGLDGETFKRELRSILVSLKEGG